MAQTRKRLTDLTINEVSVTRKAANPHTRVLIRKSDWEAAIDEAFRQAHIARDRALEKTKRKQDGVKGYKKRSAKIQKRLDAEIEAIKASIGQPAPVAKAKKTKPPKVLTVDESTYEEDDDPQPEKLGPSSNNDPSSYPCAKSETAAAREARIQKAADQYCSTVLQKGTTGGDAFAQSRAMFEAYRKGLFTGSIRAAEHTPTVGPDPTYDRLMAQAQKLAKRDPSRTVAQHFANLWESPQEVLKRASPPGSADTDDDEDDFHDPEAMSGDMDDDPEGSNVDIVGDRAEPPGAVSGGTSRGRYEHSGVPTMTNSRGAAGGPPPRSYNPKARPRSATRR